MSADSYDSRNKRILFEIRAKKAIYKFRTFMYSVYKDVRHDIFDACRGYLENELTNEGLTISEREQVNAVLAHFQWNTFENQSILWWTAVSTNHFRCNTLLTFIHLWIDDLTVFDPEGFENESLGLR